MKKVIVFFSLVTLILIYNNSKKENINTDNMIRYRIIANSNSINDQKIKWDISRELIPVISKLNADTKEETKNNILENLSKIKEIVSKYEKNNTLSYGQNYFPDKKLGNLEFAEGDYESLVITLGEGNGENFWCLLFPPLCLLEVNQENLNNINYDLYINKVIKN